MESVLFFIIGAALVVGVIMWLTKMHTDKLSDNFENIANKVLDERSSKTREQLTAHLEPFSREMAHLQQSIVDSTKERFALKEQIEQIGQQANNLANALTHRPEMRGNWGEVLLEKMLEDSGLRKNKDYQLQTSLKDEGGARLRPDVLLYLPENKHIVIDSKLTLNSYKNYTETKSEDDLKEFERATRKHIDDLSTKDYSQARGVESPDFTIMFMPLEGAFVTLMQERAELQKYAWDKKIVLAAPSILFALLQTVASLWRLDSQNKNADEIARLGGALYDKVFAFDEDMKTLGDQLERAKKTFDETHKKLSSGGGNILTRTEKLRELGAKTKKKLTNLEE